MVHCINQGDTVGHTNQRSVLFHPIFFKICHDEVVYVMF